MKKFILFARLYASLVFLFPITVAAQLLDHYPNYVVIGAFAHHKNAVNFSGDANKNKFPARFEKNPNRNLYYVFVLSTDDRQAAIAEAVRLRADTKYFDTWVYSGPLGNIVPGNTGKQQDQDVDPVTGKVIEPVAFEINTQDRVEGITLTSSGRSVDPSRPDKYAADGAMSSDGEGKRPSQQKQSGHDVASFSHKGAEDEGMQSPNSTTDQRTTASADQSRVPAQLSQPRESELPLSKRPTRASAEPLTAEDLVGKDFYFDIFRADNGKRVDGSIDAIDFERARLMATYEGNKPVTVRMPSGNTRQVSFLCQVFGYRKRQQEFDPNNPAEDLYMDDKGSVVVPFDLVRLQKGDIAIMYNVFFYKDAAVMRPESRYEVNNLLELLNENPSYEIIIHGHTNGGASGKIIRMDTPGDFYSLTGTKQGYGSAKKLSEERAIVIREFLIHSGVAADRMAVKAWGGKKPLHDKNSVRASENVRVEIEILSK